ncbi:unnamed protein product, partial [marine sediment metagenome]
SFTGKQVSATALVTPEFSMALLVKGDTTTSAPNFSKKLFHIG